MPGEHDTTIQIKSYALVVSNPGWGIAIPKQLIKTTNLPKDAQFLSGSVSVDTLTMKFLIDVAEPAVPTRILLLAENELSKRQDIGQFMGFFTFSWGSRYLFLLEDNPT